MPIVISDVVREGDHHGQRELPLEPQRDVADDQEQGDDDREDRAACDLAPEARGDVLHPELLRVQGRGQVGLERLDLVGRERLGPHLEAPVRRRPPRSRDPG